MGFGNSPFWDAEKNRIYFTDEYSTNGSPQFYNYDIDECQFYGANVKHKEKASAIFVFPIKGEKDQFVCGLDSCVYVVQWDGCSSKAYILRKLFCVEQEFKTHGLSQAKNDPKGRLYVGTFNSRLCDPKVGNDCNLYSYDKYLGLQKVADDMKVSDGLAWSISGEYLYQVEACAHSILQYSWDPNSGKLCKK